MTVHEKFKTTGLYARLQEDNELLGVVLSLRSVTAKLANTIARTVPMFTDHSVAHMDALWSVTDRVLTKKELGGLSTAEAFLLAATFYLHDIGMAYAATDEGLKRCRESNPYQSFLAAVPEADRTNPAVESKALAVAVRKLHASAALELAIDVVPGTNVFLFESLEIREAWGETCGQIAASHHWDIEEVDRVLGRSGPVPLPSGRKGDLGYVAAILRVVDYAHINRDRASSIDHAFRNSIPSDSLVHWMAQENVDGPEREDNDLVYRSARPTSHVEAWWLYYGMLTGLDSEIRAVRRYLDRRHTSQGRFSLQSVRGALSPQEMAVYIPTDGFLPIEVSLRTGSIDRLVQLLAGESLYGPDPMAAVRELVQNARDAVMLKAITAASELDRASLTIPIKVAIRNNDGVHLLEVKDWGVGMTSKIITDYLISIASNYWESQFHIDFPNAFKSGYKPAGKFGIGFLSVFMLGEHVTIESNRVGGDRTQLTLHGVGRRGELRSLQPPSGSGTAISIKLKESIMDKLRPLDELIRIYAPLLPHPLEVDDEGEATCIRPNWIFDLPIAEFKQWILKAIKTIQQNRDKRASHEEEYFSRMIYGRYRDAQMEWSEGCPEYVDSHTRLIASFEGVSILCLRGLALQPLRTPGFVGIFDIDSAVPDVSRRQAIQADVKETIARASESMYPQIIRNLDCLTQSGFVGNQLEFLNQCASTYSRKVIHGSTIRWISSMKLPGEIELQSSGMFLQEINKRESLFLAFDTGPWTAMRRWTAMEPPPFVKEMGVVLDGIGYPRPRYRSGDDEKIGNLSELWPECAISPLFGSILELIAEAWQGNVANLTNQAGWHHSGNSVWGRLTRG